ncbi:uncharacterized protein LOC124888897 [Capsicum annuum]|uniref:uncharacterized protein LOC124888897 n=1 Tax=Capsicum annuum TaxID=4072 RepID=UPI001FB0B22F|nr:uncharacterized protein LOC124888897 [Capsicum annuum]
MRQPDKLRVVSVIVTFDDDIDKLCEIDAVTTYDVGIMIVPIEERLGVEALDQCYRIFIKDFSKITNSLCKLLEKEVKFDFDEACLKAFECLKDKLVSARIIVSPNWSLSFETICDSSGVDLDVVFGQRIEKILHPIYYANKALNPA